MISDGDVKQMTALMMWVDGFVKAWKLAGKKVAKLTVPMMWEQAPESLKAMTNPKEFEEFVGILKK